MVKSGREHLSEKVSDLICRDENSVWAREFGDICFELDEQICKEQICKEQICKGSRRCILRFDP